MKTVQICSNLLMDFDVRGQQEMDVFTGQCIIMHFGQAFLPEATV